MHIDAFAVLDELTKISARVPVWHASGWPKKTMGARAGAATFKGDTNDARLYVALRKRAAQPGVIIFGRQQRDRLKGPGIFLHSAKADTKKGWRPRITPEAQRAGMTVEDLHDLVGELDAPGSTRQSRGPIWKKLHDVTGSWINTKDSNATLRATKMRAIDRGAG